MRKLRMDLDALVVESFDTAAPSPAVGTVRAHDDSGALGAQFSCDPDTCGGGGASQDTACGPCPGTQMTHCNQGTCYPTYCPATCANQTGPCYYTCGYDLTCMRACP